MRRHGGGWPHEAGTRAQQVAPAEAASDRSRSRSFDSGVASEDVPASASGAEQQPRWPKPFWSYGEGATLEWPEGESAELCVRFQATLVEPAGASYERGQQVGPLPLLVYFSGLGAKDAAMKEIQPQALARLATRPFVLATPLRPQGHWWTIEGDGEWAWVDGEFEIERAEAFADWLQRLTDDPAIDGQRVSLLGFSAGAYAITEILATRIYRPFAVVLGGVHGHSQPDVQNFSTKRAAKRNEILDKWHAYIDRVRHHVGAPGGIFGAHHPEDRQSPHAYALHIYAALAEGQERANSEQLTSARVKCVSVPLDSESKKKGAKSSHNYIDSTFQRAWLMDHLVGLPPPVPAASSGSADAAWRRAAPAPLPRPPSPPPPPAGARQRAEPRGAASAAAPGGSQRHASARRSRSRDDSGPTSFRLDSSGQRSISVGSSRASSSGFGSDAACKKAGGGGGGRGSPRGGRPDGRCASSGRQRPARPPPQPHEARRLAPPDARRLAPPRPPPAHEERHARTPEGRRSLAACARSPGGARAAPAAAGAGAASISARGDWYIDFLQIEQADGAVDSYGKGHGGEVLPVWRQNGTGNFRLAVEPGRGDAESWRRSSEQAARLDNGETLVKVEQLNCQVGHLGARLTFTTSTGRTIVIEGQYGTKKVKHHEEHEVDVGQQVKELVFEDSRLADVVAD